MTDGLEFAIADIFDNKKLNQKCTTVGNGNQLNALIDPHAGQQIYPTDSSNGWLIDRPDSRDSVDTKWHYPQLRVGSETTIGEYPGAADPVMGGPHLQNSSVYIPFTLPTTEKFYQVKSIQGYGGNINPSATHITQAGIDIFDTSTGSSINAGISKKTSSNGGVSWSHNFQQRMYIPGGTVCAVWLAATGAESFKISRRSTGTTATSWTFYTSSLTTPYISQASSASFSETRSDILMSITYQGYY